jgi:cellulose biosynthesis protein BcsQ
MINVSFFSYKGGAGRTSLLFNTLPFLAEQLDATDQEPIVVLDLDLDSKGLSYLIDKASGINSIQVLRGDKTIGFRDQTKIENHPFFSKLVPIGAAVGLNSSRDRSILFVSAHEKEGAESLTENGNYDSSVSLTTLRKLCAKYNCKAIVMDTPAGNQISGECALSISSKIVVAMRITRQFRKGTEEFFKRKAEQYNEKEYIIVPNAVPSTEGTPYSISNIMHDINVSMSKAVGNTGNVNLSLISDGRTGINEVNSFKFREECLNNKSENELSEDETNALNSYKLLAKEIARKE